MKFNKIKDKPTNKSKDPIKLNKSNKVVKKKTKFYQQKKQTNIKTKVCIPKTKDDISANWIQMHDLIQNQNEIKNIDKKKTVKKSQKIKQSTSKIKNEDKTLNLKEKFKLKRKLKRENAKLNKKTNQIIKKTTNKQKNEIKKSDLNKTEKRNDLWFEVDQIYLEKAINPGKPAQPIKEDDLIKKNSTSTVTKTLAIDCEMVGVGSRKLSALARVSIVNQFGHTIYDKFVKPNEKVTDYRTFVSGIRANDLKDGLPEDLVKKEVENLIRGKLLVGHAIKNDLNVLGLKHPQQFIIDTSIYFKKMFNGKTPSLKRLAETLLNVKVQTGEHSSVEDAKATMRLYTLYKKDIWKTNHIKKDLD